ncbi:hypothetical protein KY290_007494 [Solanum tuberosum]|uniref:Uncharacterized protein n=1 Tax=Solanum tuberosum TaxID=4113 RepID=A0ABQ7W7Q2_SOLTU|nr:hypothetical protein KY290_007494 [Solanum tuberosum]
MALYAGKGNYAARGNYTGGDKNESVNGSRGNNNAKKKVNWNLFCDHCKMHGHT